MNLLTRTVLLVASMLVLSAGLSLAADTKSPAATAGGTAKTDIKASTATPTPAKGRLVDINSATEAELKAVPGIGAVYAAKIVAGRPYANKAQLKSRKILPSTLYEQVKELIIAKQKK